MEVLEQLEFLVLDHSPWVTTATILLATLVSEDLTCIGCGLLVARGDLRAATAVVACVLGLWIGDLTLYGWGKLLGQPALRRRPFRWWFTAEDVDKCAAWYRRRGTVVIYLARVVPGCRLPTYFAAGLLDVRFWRFSLDTFIACLVWAPLLVGLAFFVGDSVFGYFDVFRRYAIVSLIVGLLLVYAVVKVLVPLTTWKGRRLLRGAMRRKLRWEYWSSYVFYVPIFFYFLGLALRYRSLSLFTTVNPGIFAGGFVNESKTEILESLTADPTNREFVVATRKLSSDLPPHQRLEEVRAFRRDAGLDYPLVLKPDAGQRGSGVRVVRDDEEVAEYLRKTRVETIVQEFAPGREYGIFYYRLPGEERGRIFSITAKEFPEVVGDGETTLERLVLSDDSLLPMARLYLRKLGSRVFDVPDEGQRVRLVEIGNHCRGAVFRDGSSIRTPELEEAIDRISRRFDGFYFGRYDVRTPSVEDLMRGEGFKIVELNGATSEATHIYDPRNGLLDAYRTLFEQWRILFRIAARNRDAGTPVVPLGRLARLVVRYRTASRSHPV